MQKISSDCNDKCKPSINLSSGKLTACCAGPKSYTFDNTLSIHCNVSSSSDGGNETNAIK
jgi:hypothetical protein